MQVKIHEEAAAQVSWGRKRKGREDRGERGKGRRRGTTREKKSIKEVM